jgi:hyperpolarization activated cyclic nucleotide-gated potassium channel 2
MDIPRPLRRRFSHQISSQITIPLEGHYPTSLVDDPDAPERSIASPTDIPRYYFTHFSIWRRIWEYILIVVACIPVFEITFIPLFCPNISFFGYSPFLIFDLLYIIDLYVSTHTAYHSRGLLIASPVRIRRRIGYIPLILRFVGAIPIGWAVCLQGGSWHLLFALNKLLRVHRGIEAMDTVQHSLVYHSWVAMMFPLWMLLLGSIHILACVFYMTGLIENAHNYISWIQSLHDNPSKLHLYVYSVYFISVTIWTIGSGPFTAPTSSERILLIGIELIGVMINAYCVGSMVSFLIDPMSSNFLTAFSGLWDYLRFKKIPEHLRTEILNVFQAKWTAYGGSSEPKEVFKFMPETVRDHMKLDITRACFRKISMMQIASEPLLVTFANVMKPFTACPGEMLIRQNELMPVLHLFREGVIRLWINGSFFAENNCDAGIGMGELELLVDVRREMTVAAVTYVEGWMLAREDLVKAMVHQEPLRNELLTICRLVFPAYFRQIRAMLCPESEPE